MKPGAQLRDEGFVRLCSTGRGIVFHDGLAIRWRLRQAHRARNDRAEHPLGKIAANFLYHMSREAGTRVEHRHEDTRDIERDWGRRGRLEDFLPTFEDWTFDFLDVPALLRSAEQVLEYPMVDQEPLPRWTFGRVTLLGDAAHPLVPRGSNGAGQAIVDCRALATALAEAGDHVEALHRYEAERRPRTTAIVHRNRANPPDAILREVCLRTGDRPFDRLEDVITRAELEEMSEGYRDLTGYSQRALA